MKISRERNDPEEGFCLPSAKENWSESCSQASAKLGSWMSRSGDGILLCRKSNWNVNEDRKDGKEMAGSGPNMDWKRVPQNHVIPDFLGIPFPVNEQCTGMLYYATVIECAFVLIGERR
ncbi:hypothetical protein E5288_WYG012873 [Bos mutus]|uniref:Uncharacterized protein n=1 Tax=Bos mutus TaxID=72004 RepID=A0A6B0QTL8_9CETA|nr:hypothetical protein [Bos mutus]